MNLVNIVRFYSVIYCSLRLIYLIYLYFDIKNIYYISRTDESSEKSEEEGSTIAGRCLAASAEEHHQRWCNKTEVPNVVHTEVEAAAAAEDEEEEA